MKSRIGLLAVLCLAASCGANYSSGERLGVVTKLSQKGVIWKSWEGEALMALPGSMASATQPECFEFNVAPEAVVKVKAALTSGARVSLVYRQWWMPPLTVDHAHVVIDVKEATQ